MDALFPGRCPICDGIRGKNKLICDECRLIPRRVSEPRCFRCGKHTDNPNEEFCEDCSSVKRFFERGTALYEYDSVNDSIARFKNASRPEYAAFYAEEISKYLGTVLKEFEADALIPIPLHPAKYKKRGYNQSELLADEISKRIKIPVRTDILFRIKNTKEQKKMKGTDRQKNLVGAFHIPQNVVELDNVILVDDVYTTGSTIDEAARILKEAGVKKVYFVTVAIGIDK